MPGGVAQCAQAQRQIGPGPAQGVAILDQRGQIRRILPRQRQHMGDARMHRQRRQRPAMRGDAIPVIQRAQGPQQGAGLGQGGLGRGRQKSQIGAVAAPVRQFQRQTGQIGHGDFGGRVFGQGAFFGARPQAIADARRDAPGAATALFGLGPADAFGHQPRHARAGIEPRPPRPPAIDDDPHPRDGQRGFRDGRGQHDPPPRPRRGQHRALRVEIHGAIQGQDLGGQVGQAGGHAADLALARQEGQNGAAGIVAGLGLGLGDQAGGFDVKARGAGQGARQVAGFHRIGAAQAFDDGGGVQQRRDRPGIQRGRHHQKLQIGAQRIAAFPNQRQPQIGIQAAFMKFVEDDQPDAVQRRIGLQHPGQDAFGHHLDPRARDRLPAHPETDIAARLLAQAFGQPFGGRPRGQTARFQHQDLARGLVHQRQRHPRGLARAGRRDQHRAAVIGHCRTQGGQRIFDRQGGGGGIGHGGVMARKPAPRQQKRLQRPRRQPI